MPFKFEVQAIALIVECGAASVPGEIIPTVKGTQKFKLTKCSLVAIPECTVEEPIEFAVETELKEISGTIYDVMKPQGVGNYFSNSPSKAPNANPLEPMK